jgi:hypothetical protein
VKAIALTTKKKVQRKDVGRLKSKIMELSKISGGIEKSTQLEHKFSLKLKGSCSNQEGIYSYDIVPLKTKRVVNLHDLLCDQWH